MRGRNHRRNKLPRRTATLAVSDRGEPPLTGMQSLEAIELTVRRELLPLIVEAFVHYRPVEPVTRFSSGLTAE